MRIRVKVDSGKVLVAGWGAKSSWLHRQGQGLVARFKLRR